MMTTLFHQIEYHVNILNMILHRDFMIPIMNFYRIPRSSSRSPIDPWAIWKNISHDTTFRHILYFRYTISYFRLDKVVILITSTINNIIIRRMMKINYFILYTLAPRFILKIFVILEEEYLSVFISLINEL